MPRSNKSYDKDLKERLIVLCMLYLDGLQEERRLLLRKKVQKQLVSLLKYYAVLKREEGVAQSTGQAIALKIAGAGPPERSLENTVSAIHSMPVKDAAT